MLVSAGSDSMRKTAFSGKGHAVWHFDQMLLNGIDVAPAPDAGALAT